ncbi:hypothetical protein C2W62_01175 [Candidatus Entotheonella serta]|nr:hypothetical protein C2W62_01175 [Candidatus Entotheonella serta]
MERGSGIPTSIHSKAQNSISSQDEAVRYTSTVGAAAVFQEETCDALAQTAAQCGETELNPCITFSFPTWGFQCLLFSMRICKWAENYFARELFGVEVVQINGSRHITRDESTTVVPGPAFQLKGAKEETIVKIFKPEYLNGIKESPVRGQEIRQGRSKTDCVWMDVTEEALVINIALGLERGTEIRQRLIS